MQVPPMNDIGGYLGYIIVFEYQRKQLSFAGSNKLCTRTQSDNYILTALLAHCAGHLF